jgi:8-oxo-dGTP pyrophosphatase MutT (NUDIX family)
MDKGQILKKEINLSIPWFEQIEKTVLLPYNNEEQVYYSIKPPDYVTALAHTTENKFIILKQYRPAIEDYTFELPSGHVEEGEDPVRAMIRELKEEAGCNAGSVTLLGELLPDTGRLENRLWPFYIKNLVINELPDPAENEGIEVILVSRDELVRMIHEGKLHHSHDLAVIALAILNKHLEL